MPAFIESKRFWAAVATVIAVIANTYFNLPEEEVQNIVMVVVAWIVGDSLRSAIQSKADKQILSARIEAQERIDAANERDL